MEQTSVVRDEIIKVQQDIAVYERHETLKNLNILLDQIFDSPLMVKMYEEEKNKERV